MHDTPSLDCLFEPYELKGIVLPNRFVMPAMQRSWCIDGRPEPQLTEYYCRRAQGGVGLIITESCAVDHPSSVRHPIFARINDDTFEAWTQCAAAVRGHGAAMLLQLWHEGAIRLEGGEGPYSQYPTLSPSGLIRAGRPNGRAASADDLIDIKNAFVKGALMARRAGFAGVEIHCAHGYLLDQFLWAETNQRTDGYGGPAMADRVRFPAEIVREVRAAVGPEFIISLRFSQWKEVDYNARVAETPEELQLMLTALREAGVDIFHASARKFWTPEWSGSDLGIAGWAKSMTDAAVIAVGSVGVDVDIMTGLFGDEAKATGAAGMEKLARRMANGEFDLVSVGRSLIGDPDWIKKVQAGRYDEIRTFTKKDVLGEFDLSEGNPEVIAAAQPT